MVTESDDPPVWLIVNGTLRSWAREESTFLVGGLVDPVRLHALGVVCLSTGRGWVYPSVSCGFCLVCCLPGGVGQGQS